METIILYFTPVQLAKVRGVSVEQIFKEIREGTLKPLITNEGCKIPVTYKFEK